MAGYYQTSETHAETIKVQVGEKPVPGCFLPGYRLTLLADVGENRKTGVPGSGRSCVVDAEGRVLYAGTHEHCRTYASRNKAVIDCRYEQLKIAPCIVHWCRVWQNGSRRPCMLIAVVQLAGVHMLKPKYGPTYHLPADCVRRLTLVGPTVVEMTEAIEKGVTGAEIARVSGIATEVAPTVLRDLQRLTKVDSTVQEMKVTVPQMTQMMIDRVAPKLLPATRAQPTRRRRYHVEITTYRRGRLIDCARQTLTGVSAKDVSAAAVKEASRVRTGKVCQTISAGVAKDKFLDGTIVKAWRAEAPSRTDKNTKTVVVRKRVKAAPGSGEKFVAAPKGSKRKYVWQTQYITKGKVTSLVESTQRDYAEDRGTWLVRKIGRQVKLHLLAADDLRHGLDDDGL